MQNHPAYGTTTVEPIAIAKQFDLRAVKQTEYLLRVSITKDGVSEEEISVGRANGSIELNFEKHEIRRRSTGEVLAKFAEITLPVDVWTILPKTTDRPSEPSEADFYNQVEPRTGLTYREMGFN